MTAFVGEIRMFAGNFAPSGWAFCNGALMPISDNETLFNLIGTTYGGDGESTFALPNLSSRVPVHQTSSGFILGQQGGTESVTLTTQQIPAHQHALHATGNLASSGAPAGRMLALTQAATITPYGTDNPLVTLSPSAIDTAGASQPHTNLQPYVVVNFIISLFGIFPSQT